MGNVASKHYPKTIIFKMGDTSSYAYAEIRMGGDMATMSHSDSKCPIGKGLVETMSHDLLGTYGLKMTLCRVDSMQVPL